MKALAIVGRDHTAASGCAKLELEGLDVWCALLEVPAPSFDPREQLDHVLLRVLAFSMNYRDRALVLRMAASGRSEGFYVVGSDFVAEVLAVGEAVTELSPGDRVIPDCRWPPSVPGAQAGVPSNHGSREFQVLHKAALMRVPPDMARDAAASFSIGGQTAQAMVRRLQLRPGERLLLTAPRSNTSLFVLNALAGLGVEIHGVSRSDREAERLRALGRVDKPDPQSD